MKQKQRLYSFCRGEDTDICQTWITGFAHGVYYSQIVAKVHDQKPTVCFPNGFTGSQAQLVIEKYMRDHPEELHKTAYSVSFHALEEAFPCKK
jgi:hypothetical protein